MKKIPLYEKIFQYFEKKILSGDISPRNRLPTEMEIAKEFQVSRITVVRALKELEIKGYIHRIKGSGSYVNKGDWKRGKSTNKLEIISLVLPYNDKFTTDFMKGIEEIAKKQNYFVTIHNSSDDPDKEKIIVEDIISRGSHGIILYPSIPPYNMELYSKLSISQYPLVLIDKKIPGLDLSIVWANNQKGFYDITKYLMKLGHKRIIFVGTSVYSISSEFERYRGFCKAHIDNGVSMLKKNLFSYADKETIPSNYKNNDKLENRELHYLFDLLEDLKPEKRPTAITAVNDLVARSIILTAQERGISIPGDYSVTGFDNRIFSPQLPISLTTVSQPAYEIGKRAAMELFDKIKDPDSPPVIRSVDVSLIFGQSTSKLEEGEE